MNAQCWSAGPVVQSLEIRRLQSSSFARISSRGTLLVSGDGQPESITVRLLGEQLIASIDGVQSAFTRSSVRRILIDGLGGADMIENDSDLRCTLRGGDGDDWLIGGGADDSLEGGDGTDTASYSNRTKSFEFQTPTLSIDDVTFEDGHANSGSESDSLHWDVEAIIGTPLNDFFAVRGELPYTPTVFGAAGDDRIGLGNGGDGVAYGGPGDDSFDALDDGGMIICYGGAGRDTISPNGVPPIHFFSGGRGRDAINLEDSFDFVSLDLRDFPDMEDVLGAGRAYSNSLVVIGNDLDNRLIASEEGRSITLRGLGGRDTLVGSDAACSLDGGAGDDRIIASFEADSIDGGAGDDSIEGGGGNDTINGGPGNDTLIGGPGRDRIYGSDSDDVIFARDGFVDRLYGGGGTDSAQVDNSATIKDLLADVETLS